MKLVGWLRFTWESNLLPSTSYLLREEYSIRRATKQAKTQAWQVISSCFLLDTCWNDVLTVLLPRIRHEFEEGFGHRDIDCLVITHGNRTIGASLIKPLPDISNHLISGPCISSEYRSRGFGSLLLKESLLMVAKHGEPKIFGITRSTSPAARFVYPEFRRSLRQLRNTDGRCRPGAVGTYRRIGVRLRMDKAHTRRTRMLIKCLSRSCLS